MLQVTINFVIKVIVSEQLMRLILIENQISACYHPLNHSNFKRLFVFYRPELLENKLFPVIFLNNYNKPGIFGGCTTYALQWLFLKMRNKVNPSILKP